LEKKMELKEYAQNVRGFDWFYEFSDDFEVARRGRRREAELVALTQKGANWKKVWDLGGTSHLGHSLEEANWRWAGAYLWVHGVKLNEEGAKALLKENKCIDWDKVDALVKGK
jgi:hypothetical protein